MTKGHASRGRGPESIVAEEMAKSKKTAPPPETDFVTLWKMGYARESFTYVRTICDFIEEHRLDRHSPIHHPLCVALVVFYARPFKKSNVIGAIPADMVPKESRFLHRQILTMRDQVAAHTDGNPVNHAGLPANNVRLLIGDDGAASLNINELKFSAEAIRLIRALAETLIGKTTYQRRATRAKNGSRDSRAARPVFNGPAERDVPQDLRNRALDHFVPRAYLRGFTPEYLVGQKGGSIAVYSPAFGNSRILSLNKYVACEPEFYDNHPLDKHWSGTIEQRWSTIGAVLRDRSDDAETRDELFCDKSGSELPIDTFIFQPTGFGTGGHLCD